jgi:hypothetical protein
MAAYSGAPHQFRPMLSEADAARRGKSDDELLDMALQQSPRNAAGSWNKADTIRILAGLLGGEDGRRKATRIFNPRTKG